MNEYGLPVSEPQWILRDGSSPGVRDFRWPPAEPLWASPSDIAGFSEHALDQELASILGQADSGAVAGTSAHAPQRSPVGRRHAYKRPAGVRWWTVLPATLNSTLSAAVFAVVSTLSGVITYEPLRHLAAPAAHGLAPWWPVLVFGPWLTGVLSIFRRRPPARRASGWCVLLIFTGLTASLCVIDAPRTPTGFVTAGLPPLAALTCIHLLSPCRREARHGDTGQAGIRDTVASGPGL